MFKKNKIYHTLQIYVVWRHKTVHLILTHFLVIFFVLIIIVIINFYLFFFYLLELFLLSHSPFLFTSSPLNHDKCLCTYLLNCSSHNRLKLLFFLFVCFWFFSFSFFVCFHLILYFFFFSSA